MARVAYLFDRKMLSVSNLDYDSDATVLFQRLSVCTTSMVLVAAMLFATRQSKDNVKGLTTFFLVVANAGLIMVDNIHFQYNSILLGKQPYHTSTVRSSVGGRRLTQPVELSQLRLITACR